jgi:hypothetical protein
MVGTGNTAHGHDSTPGQTASRPSVGPFFTNQPGGATDGASANHQHGFTSGVPNINHQHSMAGDFGQTDNGGFAGTAMASLPPYMNLNYIIKAA